MESSYSKVCKECNNTIYYKDKYKLQRSLLENKSCKKCVVTNRNKKISKSKQFNPAWKGYKDIPFNWFSKYFLRGERSKKRLGSITIEDVYNLWVDQNKKCSLSGIDIGFYDDGINHTCSIDRIDSLKEYTIDNIQLVHKDINLMKNKFNQEYFIQMCNLVTNNLKNQNTNERA